MDETLTYKELENKIKELEQRLQVNQELLEKSIDVIWKMDLRLRFTYVTPSVYSATGFTPQEWVGSKLSSHASFREFMKMARIAFSIIKGYSENDVEVFEAVVIHKNGTPIDVEIAGKVLFNKMGLPIEVIGSTRVITERKMAERELEKKTQQLKESNAAKDRFFSIVAHDMRNPFNALIGFSELLENEVIDNKNDNIKHYSSMINKTLLKSYEYLNNLLEWSRLQLDKIEFKPETLNLKLLIEETADMLNAQSESKNIVVQHKIPGNINIIGDKNMLKTVLMNLTSNAIKYSHSNNRILITAKILKNHVVVFITDNGVGLRPEEKEKIFRIEEIYSTKGTNNEAGSGLGLILCKEFIKKHHGEIGVESQFGNGSTFWFKIPS
ncbi:MAG: PAS domain S-box protein [Bacteroidales bacterium]|nr:PAS domain S-box protein [Bacteroidales bacterium]